MKYLGVRDYAAQEHHMFSLKLRILSLKVLPVSLTGSRRVCDTVPIEEGESCAGYLVLDMFSNREQYESYQDIVQ